MVEPVIAGLDEEKNGKKISLILLFIIIITIII